MFGQIDSKFIGVWKGVLSPAIYLKAAILLILTYLSVGSEFCAANIDEADEVIVVANRDRIGKLALIKPLEIVDPDSAYTFGITTADIIARLPGVALSGQGGSLQAYALRGFSGARIQTRLSGVPLATERRAGNSASFLDPFLIGTIEVLKGPMSTLYGSGAIGGVVSLSEKNFNSTNVSASIYSEGRQSMLGLGWGNSDVSLGLALRDQNKSRSTLGDYLNDGLKRSSATFSWLKDFHPDLQFKLFFLIADGVDIGKSSADYPDKKIVQYPKEEHWLSSWTLSDNDKWTFALYAHDQLLDTKIEHPDIGANLTSSSSFDFGANWIYQWDIMNVAFRFGLDWDKRSDVETSEKVLDASGSVIDRFYNLQGSQDSRAVFFDANWILNRFVLHSGLRWTKNKQTALFEVVENNQWTGVSALHYAVNESLSLYAEVGSGFRFPTLSENFFKGTTGRGTIIGELELDAESSISRELGVEWRFGKLKLSGSIYSTKVDNYIERIEVAAGVLTYQNLGGGHIEGGEFAASYQIDKYSIGFNGHWMQGEDDAGNYLADISPARLTLNVDYKTGWGDLGLDYRYGLASGRVHTREDRLEQSSRFSARLVIPLSKKFSIKLWADNLLDDNFRLSADKLSPQSTRRGVGVSVNWQNRL